MENAFANIDRDQLQKLVPEVLRRLNEIATLPQYGTVAGQSVASIFQELLGHPARGPINDIDVFVNRALPPRLRGRGKYDASQSGPKLNKVQALGKHATGFDAADVGGSFGYMKVIVSRFNIDILRTYREGMVNYTMIAPAGVNSKQWGHDVDVSQTLVEGFDLNLVGVGINLQTKEVVATNEYLEFLRTSKMRVKTCNTPIHTLIRLANKITSGQLVGVSCDYGSERAKLEAATYCQQQYLINVWKEYAQLDEGKDIAYFNQNLVATFGNGKYKQMYDANAHLLPPLRQVSHDKGSGEGVVTLNTLVVDEPLDPNVQPLIRKLICSSFPLLLVEHAMCSDFPALYDLFAKPCVNQFARQQAFLSIEQENRSGLGLDVAANIITKYSLAVGSGGVLDLDRFDSVMSSPDVALFFFKQHHGMNVALQDKAIQAYQGCSDVDIHVIKSMGHRADFTVQFQENPKAGLRYLIEQNASLVLSLYCGYVSGKERDIVNTRIGDVLGLLSQLSKEKKEFFARNLLGLSTNKDGWHRYENTQQIPGLFNVLGNLDHFQRKVLIKLVFDFICPQFPDISSMSVNEASHLLAMRTLLLDEPLEKATALLDQEGKDLLLSSLLILFENGMSRFPASVLQEKGYHPFKGILREDVPVQDNSELVITLRLPEDNGFNDLIIELLPQVSSQALARDGAVLLAHVLLLLPAERVAEHLLQRKDEGVEQLFETSIGTFSDLVARVGDSSSPSMLGSDVKGKNVNLEMLVDIKYKKLKESIPALKMAALSHRASKIHLDYGQEIAQPISLRPKM